MSSVFEAWNLKSTPTSTPLPQLSLNTEFNKLQQQSERYFTIDKGASAADGNRLAVTIQKDQNFSLDNEEHTKFLNACIAEFNEHSARIKALDLQLTGSFILGIVATSLQFLPFINLLSFVGWGATFYFVHQRAQAFSRYQDSLTLLVAACNWSLGEGAENRINETTKLTTNSNIRNMMKSLYPVLTETQVKHLIADDIEAVFVDEFKQYKQKLDEGYNKNRLFQSNDDEIALSKHGAEFKRCIYGFNKGNASDFVDALFSAIPDLWHAMVHGWQRLKYWVQEKRSDTASATTSTSQATPAS